MVDSGIILTSSVVAALVSGLVILWNSERKLVIENITKERTKWREKIREINLKISQAHQKKNFDDIKSSGAELRLLLNPMDNIDRDILIEIPLLIKQNSSQQDIERFSIKLSLLLKHDWERAKYETKNRFYKKQKHIKRITYDEYLVELTNKEKDVIPMDNNNWFLRYQSFFGNIIVAVSVIVAVMQLSYQQEYNKNYNTLTILKEFTEKQKERQSLIVYKEWRENFEQGTPICKEELEKLYPTNDEKREIVFKITSLWNYYEAIEKAKDNGVISEEIYNTNFLPLIKKDREIFKNFPVVLYERFKKKN